MAVRPSVVLIAVVVAAAGGVAALVNAERARAPSRAEGAAGASADRPATPPAPLAAAVTTASAPAPEPAKKPDPRQQLRFPDGSQLPALNGAIDPAPVLWPEGHAFSPVVRTERAPDGRFWYVHANGFRTTTEMTFRKDLGRYDALTTTAQQGERTSTLRAFRSVN